MKKLKHLQAGFLALLLIGVSVSATSQLHQDPIDENVTHHYRKEVDKPGGGPKDPPPPPTTSIDENTDLSFQFYPNPCRDYLKVETEENEISQVSIFSLTGKEVLNEKITTSTTIDVSNFPPGFYIIHHKRSSYKFQKL